MARTAPTVDGTPTYKVLSISYIDGAGDRRTDSYRFTTGDDIAIEAHVAAISAKTNASIFKVAVKEVYEGAMSPTNATDAVFVSKDANVVVMMKEPATGRAYDIFVPAPLQSMLEDDSETPIATEVATIISTGQALQTLAYAGQQVRFSERKDKNKAVVL